MSLNQFDKIKAWASPFLLTAIMVLGGLFGNQFIKNQDQVLCKIDLVSLDVSEIKTTLGVEKNKTENIEKKNNEQDAEILRLRGIQSITKLNFLKYQQFLPLKTN